MRLNDELITPFSISPELTAHDVSFLTEKFWATSTDHMFALDPSAMILLTIQFNLAAGTLAAFAEHRPELRPLLDQMLNFDISCVSHF